MVSHYFADMRDLVRSTYRAASDRSTARYEAAARALWDTELLKIDAEGEELRVLAGGRRFFAQASPLVMFEIKAGLVVHEVPSYEHPRLHGASNLHAIRDGSRVLRTIVRERLSTFSEHSLLPRIANRLLAG